MKRAPRIELPNKRDDELPLRSLIATSVACAIAGLSVAYAISDRPVEDKPAAAAPEIAPEIAPELEPVAQPPDDIELERRPDGALAELDQALAAFDTANAAPDAAVAAADAPVAAADAPIADAPAPAAPATATEPGRPLRVESSFFAYLRCEGLRQRKGRYPCPRDRALEVRMREIVETLPTCREAHAISRGMFDVRLELGPTGEVTDLHVKAPNEGAERAVRACAAGAFRKAKTALRPKRMIVSMRWRAR